MASGISSVPIGIDLGTTYSCVGVFENDGVTIIANEQGNRITPSVVAFNDVERFVGESAKTQMTINPENTIYDAKRLIGRKFDDPTVQQDMLLWPFEVINDNGNPKIRVRYKGDVRIFSPEEVASMVLGKMKEVAETYMGNRVTRAVITVPAYFNDSQRQATKDAGTIAGLDVIRIVNEPTAAAVAYGLDKMSETERNILVFDFGGGTLDVSILNVADGIFEVKSTSGNTHLGGEDIDSRMVWYLAEELARKYQVDITDNKRAQRRLQTACERAKRILSNFHTSMSRPTFEHLNQEIFRRALEPVEDALRSAKIDRLKIDDVVLVGGSTRIPKIQSLLQDMFLGKKLNTSINPDEAVAYGAAVQAAILSGAKSEVVRDVLLLDVTPLSLGLETIGGIMSIIIPRNSTIPIKHSRTVTTAAKNQPDMFIKIYEGERTMTRDNNLLGTFILSGIPPMPAYSPEILVTFDIDSNGILHVTAVETSGGSRNEITINNNRGRLTDEQIGQMISEAENFKEEDQQIRASSIAKNVLEVYLNMIRNLVDTPETVRKLKRSEEKILVKALTEGFDWLAKNPSETEEKYAWKMKEIENICNPMLVKLNVASNISIPITQN